MTNRLYEGFRDDDGTMRVTVDGKPLDPRTDIRNHSPTGLDVGYLGSGCAQTALALLADALGDDEQAQLYYQKFKREIVAGLDRNQWLITQAEIRCWLKSVFTQE
jgi:hypothetical protein